MGDKWCPAGKIKCVNSKIEHFCKTKGNLWRVEDNTSCPFPDNQQSVEPEPCSDPLPVQQPPSTPYPGKIINNCQICGSNNSNTTIVEMCDPCYLKLIQSKHMPIEPNQIGYPGPDDNPDIAIYEQGFAAGRDEGVGEGVADTPRKRKEGEEIK